MIIVKLKGGLGNQMFQYAAGYSLTEKHHVELKLDLSFLDTSTASVGFTKRKFEMEIFDFTYRRASENDIAGFTKNQRKLWYRTVRRFFPGLIAKKNYQHDLLNFDPHFLELADEVYLDGYFQSEYYFLNSAQAIRSCFRFKTPPEGRNKELAEKISSTDSVSIHVRRGDYLNDANRELFGNICTLDYYSKAIEIMKKELPDPHFYIFSDDVNWVKQNFKIDSIATYIDFNTGENSFEDMRLMSLCRHNIIANSSFSWWGAWLNENPDKKVLAPSKWINHPGCVIEDIIPQSWRRI